MTEINSFYFSIFGYSILNTVRGYIFSISEIVFFSFNDLGYIYSAEYIGEAKGRMWYRTENYRIGIMDYDLAKRANQFNVEIQYEQSHMFSLEPNLKGLDLPFDGELNQYHIKSCKLQ